MQLPTDERTALQAVMRQAEADMATAHAEICKLQGLDPAKHDWPEWSPQANSRRWFKAIREKFGLPIRPPISYISKLIGPLTWPTTT